MKESNVVRLDDIRKPNKRVTLDAGATCPVKNHCKWECIAKGKLQVEFECGHITELEEEIYTSPYS